MRERLFLINRSRGGVLMVGKRKHSMLDMLIERGSIQAGQFLSASQLSHLIFSDVDNDRKDGLM
jgi:hypothetical protein